MIFSPPRVQSSFYEHSLKTGEVEPKQNCCCFSDANCCKCGCCYGLWLEKLHSKVSLSWSAAAAAAVVASSEEKTWRKTYRSSSNVISRSGRDLPWEEVTLKVKRREGRAVITTTKPIHHGKKIFSPFHIAQIAGKTCDGGFYLLCFPGNGVKNEAHFMVRPHLTVLLCNKKIDNRSFKKCNDPNPKELFVVVVKILAYSWCCSIISSILHLCHENVTSRLYSTFIFSLKFTLSPHCSLHNEIVLWVYSTSTQQELRSSFTNKHCQRNNVPKALSTLTHSTPFSWEQKLQQTLKSWSIFSLLLFGKGRETQRTTLKNPCNNLEKFIYQFRQIHVTS